MPTQSTLIYRSTEQRRALKERADALHCSMTDMVPGLIDGHLIGKKPGTDISDFAGSVFGPTDGCRR